MLKNATVKWQGGQRIEAIIDKRIIVLSSSNQNETMSPESILLISLGSSCALEIISLLKISKIEVDSFELNIQATREKLNSNIFKGFNIDFVCSGKSINIPKLIVSIENAIFENSGIAIMFSKFATLNYKLFVNGVTINKEDYFK